VVCTPRQKAKRARVLRSYGRRALARRKAFFRRHRGAAARHRYVKRQRRRIAALSRALARCANPVPAAGSANVVAENPVDPAPPPCAPSLFAAPSAAMNEGTSESVLPLTVDHTLPAVMIFVDFPNVQATESTTQLHNQLVPNSKAWVSEVSYGRAALEVVPVHRWYRMPRASNAYGFGDGLTFEEHRDYIADAVAAADADIDFSRFRLAYVVAARGSALQRSPAFHAMPGIGIDVDGTELRYAATFGNDIRSEFPAKYGSHVLVHETGHLLGLPDLYDFGTPTYPGLLRFVGGWDMMSSTGPGSHFLAWHKWKLGWLDATQLTCLSAPGQVTTTLTPLARSGGLKAVVVLTGPSTAYVVEARTRTGQDARLCEDGVLVYSVDATVRGGGGPVRVRPAQPDRSAENVHSCGLLYNAPFDRAVGEVARFADESAGLALDVLGSSRAGYRVRVTRT
jgi:M6 family metalloprotease-like protein